VELQQPFGGELSTGSHGLFDEVLKQVLRYPRDPLEAVGLYLGNADVSKGGHVGGFIVQPPNTAVFIAAIELTALAFLHLGKECACLAFSPELDFRGLVLHHQALALLFEIEAKRLGLVTDSFDFINTVRCGNGVSCGIKLG
jgi:hypothetical protein